MGRVAEARSDDPVARRARSGRSRVRTVSQADQVRSPRQTAADRELPERTRVAALDAERGTDRTPVDHQDRSEDMTRQTTIPNTDPIEPHPEIRTKLHAWLDAVEAAAAARDTSKRRHDELLDAIQEAKIPYYTYDADGKRKRVYPTVADPKLKTQNVASLEPKGRRGRARDVALPIDKEREKAVDALVV